mgnify:CR=1 FL=1
MDSIVERVRERKGEHPKGEGEHLKGEHPKAIINIVSGFNLGRYKQLFTRNRLSLSVVLFLTEMNAFYGLMLSVQCTRNNSFWCSISSFKVRI